MPNCTRKKLQILFCGLLMACNLWIGNCYATEHLNIDSLRLALKNSPPDSSRIFILNKLANVLSSTEVKEAENLVGQALQLANRLKYQPGIANSYKIMGLLEYNKGNFHDAISYFEKELMIRVKLENPKKTGDTYNNIGMAFIKQAKYSDGLENLLKALKIQEKIDDKSGLAKSYHNIGMIYDYQKNYEMAITQYSKSLQYKKEISDSIGMGSTYANIGTIFSEQGNNDDALKYYLNAKKIFELTKDPMRLNMIKFNIGNVYQDQKKYQRAYKYYTDLLEELKDDDNDILMAYVLYSIGTLHQDQNNPNEAIKYLNKGISLFEKSNSNYDLIEAYSDLTDQYKKIGAFKNALDVQSKLMSVKDTLHSHNSTKIVAEMQTKYETKQKEQQIELLSKDQKLKATQRNALIALAAALLLIALVIFNRFRLKKKANEKLTEKNTIINTQKEDLQKQKNHIVDSINYAKRIQESILPSDHQIKKYLPESFIFFRPRDIVSGDFYWFCHVKNCTILAAIDCTGHGVPGALMSMIGNSLLNEIVLVKQETNPGKILEKLHLGVFKALKQENKDSHSQDGMDMSVCVIPEDKKSLHFSGAMNNMYAVKNGEITNIKADFHSIGGHPLRHEKGFHKKFSTEIIPIEEPTCFYMFSDGYMDQFGGNPRKKFGSKRFKQMLLEIYKEPMEDQKFILEKTMDEWIMKNMRLDDILVIGFKI